jgi:hypothetical protein
MIINTCYTIPSGTKLYSCGLWNIYENNHLDISKLTQSDKCVSFKHKQYPCFGLTKEYTLFVEHQKNDPDKDFNRSARYEVKTKRELVIIDAFVYSKYDSDFVAERLLKVKTKYPDTDAKLIDGFVTYHYEQMASICLLDPGSVLHEELKILNKVRPKDMYPSTYTETNKGVKKFYEITKYTPKYVNVLSTFWIHDN